MPYLLDDQDAYRLRWQARASLLNEIWVSEDSWASPQPPMRREEVEPLALTLQTAFPLPTEKCCWSHQLLVMLDERTAGTLEQVKQHDGGILEVVS